MNICSASPSTQYNLRGSTPARSLREVLALPHHHRSVRTLEINRRPQNQAYYVLNFRPPEGNDGPRAFLRALTWALHHRTSRSRAKTPPSSLIALNRNRKRPTIPQYDVYFYSGAGEVGSVETRTQRFVNRALDSTEKLHKTEAQKRREKRQGKRVHGGAEKCGFFGRNECVDTCQVSLFMRAFPVPLP